jgi:chromate reductase
MLQNPCLPLFGGKYMFNIAVIVGSLRKESFNKKLAHALGKLQHPKLRFNQLDLSRVPLYNQDHESILPPAVVTLKNEIENSDGILFVTPEYNRSIPGVLKNIIDWGSRPYGKNSWANKPSAIIGTSPGTIGTAAAQAHLRSILVTLSTIVLGHPEVYFVYKDELIDEEYNITNEGTRKFLQEFLDRFSRWLEDHGKKN